MKASRHIKNTYSVTSCVSCYPSTLNFGVKDKHMCVSHIPSAGMKIISVCAMEAYRIVEV
jgi:hypothetical protein